MVILNRTDFDAILGECLDAMEAKMAELGSGDAPLDSILAQLRALEEATACGRDVSAELKARFTFGLLASKALVQIDARLSDRIMQLSSYVATRMFPPRELG